MRRATPTRRRLLLAGAQAASAFSLFGASTAMRSALAAGQTAAEPHIAALAFDKTSRSLYRAGGAGVYRSVDDGRSWSMVRTPVAQSDGGIASLAISAGAKPTLYGAGPGRGVVRSDDGGATWSARNEGLASLNVAALTAHADRPATVYAYVEGSGIFRSEDAGDHWRLMDAGPRGGITGFAHSNMPGSMQSGWLFVAGPRGVSRAMDCFCGWRDAGELGRAAHAVAYDPEKPASVYAATETGLVKSSDGGQTWIAIDSPVPRADALVLGSGSTLYLAASAAGGLFRRAGAAVPWERLDG